MTNRNKKRDDGLTYTIIRPESHEGWLAERTQGIGASDAASVLGVDSFCTPYMLWRKKVGLDAPTEMNFAMEMGHAMEYYVAQCFEENTGIQIIKSSDGDWLAVDNQRPYLRVSPDRIYWLEGKKHNLKNRGICECKTSLRKDHEPDCLQNECKNYFCQLQYQMHVMGLKEGYIAYMCLINGHRWFQPVKYDADFCNDLLIPAIDEMWNRYILPARQFLEIHRVEDPLNMCAEYYEAIHEFAPPSINADDVSLRYKHQQDGKIANAADLTIDNCNVYLLLDEYNKNRDAVKALDERQHQIEDSIKMAMGDTEAILGDDGKALVTWRNNKASTKFDDKRFKAEHSDLYAQYLTEKAGARVFKIK